MENPIRRITGEQARKEREEFRQQLMDQIPTHTIGELELQIAERKFREPKRIIGKIYLQPFWGEGKEAPPLPMAKSINPYRGHW